MLAAAPPGPLKRLKNGFWLGRRPPFPGPPPPSAETLAVSWPRRSFASRRVARVPAPNAKSPENRTWVPPAVAPPEPLDGVVSTRKLSWPVQSPSYPLPSVGSVGGVVPEVPLEELDGALPEGELEGLVESPLDSCAGDRRCVLSSPPEVPSPEVGVELPWSPPDTLPASVGGVGVLAGGVSGVVGVLPPLSGAFVSTGFGGGMTAPLPPSFAGGESTTVAVPPVSSPQAGAAADSAAKSNVAAIAIARSSLLVAAFREPALGSGPDADADTAEETSASSSVDAFCGDVLVRGTQNPRGDETSRGGARL